MRRDLRWCQGNMQYFRFLSLDNLKPVSRYQLLLAILMFIGSPAWIALLVLATIALVSFDRPAQFIRADVGNALFAWVLVMWFSPKIFTVVDLLLRKDARRAFGGGARIAINFMIETIYSVLLCPILWISHTIFLARLLFNREIGWIGQVRDDHAVSFRSALSTLWPQTLLGWTAIGLVSAMQPAGLPYVLFLAAGPAFAIPFAMLTAWPVLGRLAVRVGIGRLPEETVAPKELLALSLPAVCATLQPSATGSV
jgi:membrane glycosyltransferase